MADEKEKEKILIQRGDIQVDLNQVRNIVTNDFNLYFGRSGFTENLLQEIANEVNNILTGLENNTITYSHGPRGGFRGIGLNNKKDLKKGEIDTVGYAAGIVGNAIRAAEEYKKPEYKYKDGEYEYNNENLTKYLTQQIYNKDYSKLSKKELLDVILNNINLFYTNALNYKTTPLTAFPNFNDDNLRDLKEKIDLFNERRDNIIANGIIDDNEYYWFRHIFGLPVSDWIDSSQSAGQSETPEEDPPITTSQKYSYLDAPEFYILSFSDNAIQSAINEIYEFLLKSTSNSLIKLINTNSDAADINKNNLTKIVLKSMNSGLNDNLINYLANRINNGTILAMIGKIFHSLNRIPLNSDEDSSGYSWYGFHDDVSKNRIYIKNNGNDLYYFRVYTPSAKNGGVLNKFDKGGTIRKFRSGSSTKDVAFYATKAQNEKTYTRRYALLKDNDYIWDFRNPDFITTTSIGSSYNYDPINQSLWNDKDTSDSNYFWNEWVNELLNNEELAKEWANGYLKHSSKKNKDGKEDINNSPYYKWFNKWFDTSGFNYTAFKDSISELVRDGKLGPGHDMFAKSVYRYDNGDGTYTYYDADYKQDDNLLEEIGDWEFDNSEGVWIKNLQKNSSQSMSLPGNGNTGDGGEGQTGGDFVSEQHPSVNLFDFDVKTPGYDWVSDTLDAMRLGVDLYGNDKNKNILLEGSPSLLNPKERRYGVYGDFGAKNYYDNLANLTLSFALLNQTSDASLNKAAAMDAFSRALDLKAKGLHEDNKRIFETMDKSVLANWWSHENRVDTANSNRDRLFNWNEERKKIRASHNQAMFNSLSEYLLGITNRNREDFETKKSKQEELSQTIGLNNINSWYRRLYDLATNDYNLNPNDPRIKENYNKFLQGIRDIRKDLQLNLQARLAGLPYNRIFSDNEINQFIWSKDDKIGYDKYLGRML